VDLLLTRVQNHGRALSREGLVDLVQSSDKQRFAFDEAGKRIRSNQGHSVEVELGLPSATPPELLFHGTLRAAVGRILRSGLLKMSRHAVHLSPDPATAAKVGMRRGEPVVLVVQSGRMSAAGYRLELSANGVWLTDRVPANFVRLWNRLADNSATTSC